MSSLTNKQQSIFLSHRICSIDICIKSHKITLLFPILRYSLLKCTLFCGKQTNKHTVDVSFIYKHWYSDRIFYSNPIQIFILVLFHLFHLYFRYFTNIIVSIFYIPYTIRVVWLGLKEGKWYDFGTSRLLHRNRQ